MTTIASYWTRLAARGLVTLLQQKAADDGPRMGYPISMIAKEIDCNEDRARYLIGVGRNTLTGAGDLVVHFKIGRTYYYKIAATAQELDEYVQWRYGPISSSIANILFQTRKADAQWVGNQNFAWMRDHQVDLMEILVAMGVEGAADKLMLAQRTVRMDA